MKHATSQYVIRAVRKTQRQASKFAKELCLSTDVRFFCIVLLLAVSLSVFNKTNTSHENLFFFHNDTSTTGGPFATLNVHTENLEIPAFSRVGCDAVSVPHSGKGKHLRMYCIGGKEDQNVFDVLQTKTGGYEIRGITVEGRVQPAVPVHARILFGAPGEEFYTVGGPLVMGEQGNLNDAGVLIVEGETSDFVPISDDSKPYFIYRMKYDGTSQKLWVMSHTGTDVVLIDRIDVKSHRVDFSATIDATLGYDLLVTKKYVLVSTYRTPDGFDVQVFDRVSGEKLPGVSLPVNTSNDFNALSLLEFKDKILASSLGGVFVLDSNTLDVHEFIANNTASQFTDLAEGKDALYAIDGYKRVVKIDSDNLTQTKTLYESESAGLVNLHSL